MSDQPHNLPWCKEKELELRELYVTLERGKYYSHGLIAIKMGMNRSAVIGKIHRLKLTRDPNTPYITHQGITIDPKVTSFAAKGPREPRPKRVKTVAKVVNNYNKSSIKKARAPTPMAKDGPGEFVGVVSPFACQVTELNGKTCHFPIGHVGKPGFHFCGATVAKGSYCLQHANICMWTPRTDTSVPRPYVV